MRDGDGRWSGGIRAWGIRCARPIIGRVSKERPARGRPAAIDADALARVATELFGARGYDDVSMNDVAAAARVSRRSLFRYFPTKADLVWHGFQPVEERIDAVLAGWEGDPFEGAAAATLASLEAMPGFEQTRIRLRIIAAHPDLIAFGVTRVWASAGRFVSYFRSRGVEELRARVLADVFATAILSGLTYWASETTDADPQAVVRRVLAHLEPLR